MPFTPSHAAAVLPFVGTGLPASALVAGSLVPDLPLYLPFDLGLATHTAVAVVTVDVLLGVLLWVAWHGLLAAPALHTAPRAVRARVAGSARPGLRVRVSSVRAVVLVLVAVAVGAATHVAWDEFTHAGRFGADHLGVLADTWAGRPGHRWAQDASGVLGAAVLAGWLRIRWRRTVPSGVEERPGPRWPVHVVVAVAVLGGLSALPGAGDLRSAAVAAAERGGGCAVAAVVVLALVWHLLHPTAARR